jgi:acetyl-CoA synthetase
MRFLRDKNVRSYSGACTFAEKGNWRKPMLTRHDDYAELARSFVWDVPDRYNIGVDVCDRHADDPGRVALIVEEEDGSVRRYTFAEMRGLTNRLCNVLAAHGLKRGDRLAVLLPQSPETAIGHVAGLKAGLVTIPLFALFGEEALEYRLGDSGGETLGGELLEWGRSVFGVTINEFYGQTECNPHRGDGGGDRRAGPDPDGDRQGQAGGARVSA